MHLLQKQVNSLRLGNFGILHGVPLLSGQYVKGSCSFISYNFNYCLEPNNAVEHINWDVIGIGLIFCRSGRTIILNDSLSFIIFQLPICKATHLVLLTFSSHMKIPNLSPCVRGSKKKDGRICPVCRTWTNCWIAPYKLASHRPSVATWAPTSLCLLWDCPKLPRDQRSWPTGGAGVPCGLEFPTLGSFEWCHCKTSVLNKLNPLPEWRTCLLGRRYSNSQRQKFLGTR
jgi:hypothetical protein